MGVETALVVGSLAATGASAGMSFAQAGKQKKLQKEAEMAAEKALEEARKKLDVNFYEGLGINKQPYELQRDAMLASGAQAIAAGVESERGAAGVAGAVQMAQNKAQQEIASQMGTEMNNLDKLIASEDARLAGEQAGLYLGEAEGAQLAARDAQQANAAFLTQGLEGVTDLASSAVSLAPLYSKEKQAPPTNTPKLSTNPNVTIPFAPAPNYSIGQLAPKVNGPQIGWDFPSLGGNTNDQLFQEFLQWKKANNK